MNESINPRHSAGVVSAPTLTRSSTVQVQIDAQGIATLTVNRPEALNALNLEVLDAIGAAAQDLRGKAKAIIVTGAGPKAFVAGADIAQMASLSPKDAEAFSRRGNAAFNALADFPGAVIAAVNGFALGGGLELALACDILVASEKASLGQPEVNLAVVPGFGGTQRLPRRVGPGYAKWLLMSAERIPAAEALRVGLVDRVVAPEALMETAHKMALACSQPGPLAVAQCKRLVDEGLQGSLADGLDLESSAFGAMFATADQKEGMRAFLEKRPAKFTGH